MLTFYILLVVVIAITMYEIIAKDEDNILDLEMSNKEYEKRFIYAVSRIDKGNINWTIEALREIKGDSKYYCSNPRAIAILNKLEAAVKTNNTKVIEFIKKCHLYN